MSREKSPPKLNDIDVPKRRVIIDDKYREKLSSRNKVNKENIEIDLLNHSEYLDAVVTDIRKMMEDRKQIKQTYNKMYKLLWDFYTFESEEVPENDTEKKNMIHRHERMTDVYESLEDIEEDMKFLMDTREVLKDKLWSLKYIIDYRKFLAGN